MEQDLAGIEVVPTDQAPQQGGLAGAVDAADHQHLASLDRQADVLEHRLPAERLRHMTDFEHRGRFHRAHLARWAF